MLAPERRCQVGAIWHSLLWHHWSAHDSCHQNLSMYHCWALEHEVLTGPASQSYPFKKYPSCLTEWQIQSIIWVLMNMVQTLPIAAHFMEDVYFKQFPEQPLSCDRNSLWCFDSVGRLCVKQSIMSPIDLRWMSRWLLVYADQAFLWTATSTLGSFPFNYFVSCILFS